MKTDEKYFSAIQSDFDNSLVYIKKSLLNLKDYHQTGNDKYENEYVNNLNKGLDYSFKGRVKALNRYNYYLNAINKPIAMRKVFFLWCVFYLHNYCYVLSLK